MKEQIWSEEDRRQLRDLALDGAHLADIARQFGRRQGAVAQEAARMGLTVRTVQQRR
jgi:transposase-like protein